MHSKQKKKDREELGGDIIAKNKVEEAEKEAEEKKHSSLLIDLSDEEEKNCDETVENNYEDLDGTDFILSQALEQSFIEE